MLPRNQHLLRIPFQNDRCPLLAHCSFTCSLRLKVSSPLLPNSREKRSCGLPIPFQFPTLVFSLCYCITSKTLSSLLVFLLASFFNFLTGEQWMASKGLRALSSSTSSGHPRRRSSSGTLCLSAYLQISRTPWHHTGSIGGMTSSVRNPWSASRGTTPWEASSVTSGLLSKLCRSPKAPLLSTQAWLRGSRHLRRDR